MHMHRHPLVSLYLSFSLSLTLSFSHSHTEINTRARRYTRAHTQAHAYRMYFKSLMCEQLILFAQTTCSFWTQTKLWRSLEFVNSVGCVGDALHQRSLSTWCRLHQMVEPCRTAASSNRTHTQFSKNEASTVRNILTRFAISRSTTSSGAETADRHSGRVTMDNLKKRDLWICLGWGAGEGWLGVHLSFY